MWFSIVINQPKQFRYFSELALGYVHTTMPYWKVFTPARKPYQIGSLLTHKNGDCRAISVTEQCCSALIFTVESHCLLGSVENEALENDSKTKHSKLENGAPKAPKRSTKKSKTEHPKLETCLSFRNTRQSVVKSPAAEIKHDIK